MIELDRKLETSEIIVIVESQLIAEGIKRLINPELFCLSNVSMGSLKETDEFKTKITVTSVRNEWLITEVNSILEQNPSMKIVLVANIQNFDDIQTLLMLGVKGILYLDTDPIIFQEALKQINKGYVYFEPYIMGIFLNLFKDLVSTSNDRNNEGSFQAGMNLPLTKREKEILIYMAEGYSNGEMTEKLYISEKTVKNHVSNILAKFCVASRSAAVAKALKNGWIYI